MTLDELDELEDEEEERILEQYKKARMAEIKAMQAKSRFGDVRDISAEDYVNEVNKAGEGIFVVLHLYKQGVPLCALINQYLTTMAMKYPTVKFLRSISTTCIPNYPDHNLPTIFVYHEGEMKAQLAGPHNFRGMNMSADEFEFLIGKATQTGLPYSFYLQNCDSSKSGSFLAFSKIFLTKFLLSKGAINIKQDPLATKTSKLNFKCRDTNRNVNLHNEFPFLFSFCL